jgi:hypothetical protein
VQKKQPLIPRKYGALLSTGVFVRTITPRILCGAAKFHAQLHDHLVFVTVSFPSPIEVSHSPSLSFSTFSPCGTPRLLRIHKNPCPPRPSVSANSYITRHSCIAIGHYFASHIFSHAPIYPFASIARVYLPSHTFILTKRSFLTPIDSTSSLVLCINTVCRHMANKVRKFFSVYSWAKDWQMLRQSETVHR